MKDVFRVRLEMYVFKEMLNFFGVMDLFCIIAEVCCGDENRLRSVMFFLIPMKLVSVCGCFVYMLTTNIALCVI